MSNLTKETVDDDLQQLSTKPSGCKFWRLDLHTHTPASSDYRWEEETTPHDIVAAYANKGISLISVTDHSTGAWVDRMKDAGKKYAKRHKVPFCVIPGVELNVSGIHIQAIFPEQITTKRITLFLGRLGLEETDFGNESTMVDKTISEVADEVKKDGGIIVGSHCNTKNGAVNGLKGETRQMALDKLDILEINAGQDSSKARKSIDYVRNNLGYLHKPFVFSSDAHAADEIIESVSFIKMDSPSFDGLRQIIHEPLLRSPGRNSPENGTTKILVL
jgi:predicted metal-dependent phosphoesterase TrpH